MKALQRVTDGSVLFSWKRIFTLKLPMVCSLFCHLAPQKTKPSCVHLTADMFFNSTVKTN